MTGLSACGDDPDPEQVVEEAFSQPIESANVSLSLAFDVEGGEEAEPFRVELSGPCTAADPDRFASFDYDAALQGGGASISGLGLISTGNNAFVEHQGVAYAVGRRPIARVNRAIAESGEAGPGCGALGLNIGALGLDPGAVIEGASVEGEEEVAETPTTHVAGSIDVPTVLAELNALTRQAAQLGAEPAPTLSEEQLAQLDDRIEGATIDLFAGRDDGKLRRLAVTLDIAAAEGAEDELAGVTGGTVSLVVEYADVGSEQRITPPEDPQPLADLAQQLGGLGGILGGPEGSGGEPPDGGAVPAP